MVTLRFFWIDMMDKEEYKRVKKQGTSGEKGKGKKGRKEWKGKSETLCNAVASGACAPPVHHIVHHKVRQGSNQVGQQKRAQDGSV
jgi:hypothetical protein